MTSVSSRPSLTPLTVLPHHNQLFRASGPVLDDPVRVTLRTGRCNAEYDSILCLDRSDCDDRWLGRMLDDAAFHAASSIAKVESGNRRYTVLRVQRRATRPDFDWPFCVDRGYRAAIGSECAIHSQVAVPDQSSNWAVSISCCAPCSSNSAATVRPIAVGSLSLPEATAVILSRPS